VLVGVRTAFCCGEIVILTPFVTSEGETIGVGRCGQDKACFVMIPATDPDYFLSPPFTFDSLYGNLLLPR
jgi:hypothetical protein